MHMSVAEARPRVATTETDWAGYGAFAGASLIWGSTFLFIAISNDIVAPLWGSTLRLAIASVGLIPIALLTRASFPRGAALRDVALYGLFQFGMNLALLYWGEQWVPSGMTAVVFATAPLQTALFGRALRVEAVDRVKILAAIVALVGVTVIFAGQLDVGIPLIALIAVFLAATTAAFGSVLLRRAGKQSPWAVNAIGAPIGAVVCLGVSALLGEPWDLPATAGDWLPIVYLAIFGSLGAFVLYAWLLGRWGPTNASFIGVVVPVIALILGAAVRAEYPPLVSFAGAALVILAVVVALTRSRANSH
jgi:drug/metabolite transporter (DMT)-like permease